MDSHTLLDIQDVVVVMGMGNIHGRKHGTCIVEGAGAGGVVQRLHVLAAGE